MSKAARRQIGLWLTGILCCLLATVAIVPQHSDPSALEVTTQERLESEPWWPTMSTAPLKAYAGSNTCLRCHSEGTTSTGMQRTASVAGDQPFLRQATAATLSQGDHKYQLTSSQHDLSLNVSANGKTYAQKLAWVIGAGDLGRTFLYQTDGRWLQSEVSFYTAPAALDITTGLGPSHGDDLKAALGQPLTEQDARACFSCHTVHATTSAGLQPLHAEAGLGCEACHGPAAAHVAKMAAPAQQTSHPDSQAEVIFDPSKLSPADSIDFCGACHRTSADARLSVTSAFGSTAVRFQPYRLEESKCWRATKDARLTCVACHDPHQPLERDAASYDRHCLSCHAPAAGTPAHAAVVCQRATSHCTSCHMPKVQVPTMHGQFTDHDIRIARAGDPLPR